MWIAIYLLGAVIASSLVIRDALKFRKEILVSDIVWAILFGIFSWSSVIGLTIVMILSTEKISKFLKKKIC